MLVVGFWALVILAVTWLVFFAMPSRPRSKRRSAAPSGIDVLSIITRFRPTWALAIGLDVVLIAILAIWYANATNSAPHYPIPSAGRVFAMPVPVGYVHGVRGSSSTVFGVGYVDLPTSLVGWMLISNTALFLLWGFYGFFRGVWGPTPLTDDAPSPPNIDPGDL